MKKMRSTVIYGSVWLVLLLLCLGPRVRAAGDLIGYWNFDEASGASITDSSGNANNGTITGTGVLHSSILPPTSCFINTHSVQFDGSGGYVSIADNSSMDPASQISISFWMNPDTVTNGYQHLIFKQGPVVTSYGVWLNGDHVYMEDNDNSIRGLNSNATVTPGAWHYITVTYDGSDQKLYIDGALDNSQSVPGITLAYTNSPVKVGSGDYNNPFAGYIDDLRIYGRALTASEVADLAGGGCGPGVTSNIGQSSGGSQPTATPSATAATLTDTGIDILPRILTTVVLLLGAIGVKCVVPGRGRRPV